MKVKCEEKEKKMLKSKSKTGSRALVALSAALLGLGLVALLGARRGSEPASASVDVDLRSDAINQATAVAPAANVLCVPTSSRMCSQPQVWLSRGWCSCKKYGDVFKLCKYKQTIMGTGGYRSKSGVGNLVMANRLKNGHTMDYYSFFLNDIYSPRYLMYSRPLCVAHTDASAQVLEYTLLPIARQNCHVDWFGTDGQRQNGLYICEAEWRKDVLRCGVRSISGVLQSVTKYHAGKPPCAPLPGYSKARYINYMGWQWACVTTPQCPS